MYDSSCINDSLNSLSLYPYLIVSVSYQPDEISRAIIGIDFMRFEQ